MPVDGSNPFLQGGLVLMAVGAAAAYARNAPRLLWRHVRDAVVTTYTTDDREAAFHWLRPWLAHKLDGRRLRNARAIVEYADGTAVSIREAKGSVDPADGEDGHRDPTPQITMVPGEATYFMRHRGRTMLVTTAREKPEQSGGSAYAQERETITVTVYGPGAEAYLRQIINDAYTYIMGKRTRRIGIYVPGAYDGWALADERAPRPPGSVILAGGLYGKVADDLRAFRTGQAWYADHGVPWRRGYLLEGPPGNGKTSLVAALASEFRANVRVLALGVGMSDSRLHGLMAGVPAMDLVLLEDVDAAFAGRAKGEGTGDALTFSGLLNAIDGIGSKEGRVLFMTTNHPDKLDPALVRPGRVDMRVTIGNATPEQCEAMYNRFFPGANGEAATWAATVPEGTSMARVQELLVQKRAGVEVPCGS